ncbi:MAG: hypothetical protein WAX38_01960 [Minisyncoccia bacterium]
MIPTLALSLPPLAWILGGGLLLTAGDIFMRYYVESPETTWLFVAGFSMYVLGLLSLSCSFFGEDIVIASVAIVLVNVVTLTLVNLLVFHKSLSVMGYVGVVLGVIAFVILEFNT